MRGYVYLPTLFIDLVTACPNTDGSYIDLMTYLGYHMCMVHGAWFVWLAWFVHLVHGLCVACICSYIGIDYIDRKQTRL